MKKLFISLLAAAAVLTACSDKEDNDPQTVDTITTNLENNQISLNKGQTFQLQFTTSPAKDAEVSLYRLSEKVATIDENFLITAVSGGSYTAMAQAVKGTTKAQVEFTITVIAPVESIEVVSGSELISVNIGGTASAATAFRALPASATNKTLKFESRDTNIATIDENTGEITGITEGTARIFASATDGSNVTSPDISVSVSESGAAAGPITKTGWSASASSTLSSYTAAKTIDGVRKIEDGDNENSFWQSNSRTHPHWLMIDTKKLNDFNRVDIFRPAKYYTLKTIEIWISKTDADGLSSSDESFEQIGEVTFDDNNINNLKVSKSFYPETQSARYIKLVMNESYDTTVWKTVAIEEVDLYMIE